MRAAFTFVLLATVLGSSQPPSTYPVKEYHFDAVIDHFNFRPTTPATFPLRYYVNDNHWKNATDAPGPIFYYTGNEADIFQFVNNSGFMFEAAEEFGAMVVFAEHRYYGLSNPFGNEYALGKPNNVSYLTVEQAMEDFNTHTVSMREKWGMPAKTPFIAFGGSYGGNLALWLRLKNPNIWAGAIASSATPLKHLLRESNSFALIVTQAYGNVSSKCPDLVREGWKDLFGGVSTAADRAKTSKALGLCHALPNAGAAEDVAGWVEGALETMVQYGYPYPTDFYNPVPGYPFKVACEGMVAANTGLGALRAAASVYYNYSGQAGDCFDVGGVSEEARKFWHRKGQRHELQKQDERAVEKEMTNKRSASTAKDKSGQNLKWAETQAGWGYQCCTEVYQPMPTNGVTDFYRPSTPNKTDYFNNCVNNWGVKPRPDWEEMMFMGR
jgi:hypothetical protein